jgi:hypothetical protein
MVSVSRVVYTTLCFFFTVAEGILRAGTEQGISVRGGWVREAGIC